MSASVDGGPDEGPVLKEVRRRLGEVTDKADRSLDVLHVAHLRGVANQLHGLVAWLKTHEPRPSTRDAALREEMDGLRSDLEWANKMRDNELRALAAVIKERDALGAALREDKREPGASRPVTEANGGGDDGACAGSATGSADAAREKTEGPSPVGVRVGTGSYAAALREEGRVQGLREVVPALQAADFAWDDGDPLDLIAQVVSGLLKAHPTPDASQGSAPPDQCVCPFPRDRCPNCDTGCFACLEAADLAHDLALPECRGDVHVGTCRHAPAAPQGSGDRLEEAARAFEAIGNEPGAITPTWKEAATCLRALSAAPQGKP